MKQGFDIEGTLVKIQSRLLVTEKLRNIFKQEGNVPLPPFLCESLEEAARDRGRVVLTFLSESLHLSIS